MREVIKGDKLLGECVGFKDNNENRPIYQATKDVKVKIIDWKPIIDIINKDEGSNFEIRSGKGIIELPNGKYLLIDEECCGVESEGSNYLLGGQMLSATVFNGIGIFERDKDSKGGNFISMYPKHYVDIDLDNIKLCFTGEEKELWDFMGGRYEYNPRIHSNMRGIIKLVKESKENNQDKE